MSKFDQIKIDDLGLEFMELDKVISSFDLKKTAKEEGSSNPLELTFGPSQTQ